GLFSLQSTAIVMKRDEGRGTRDELRKLFVWSWEFIGSYLLRRDEGRGTNGEGYSCGYGKSSAFTY
ncbi:MAG: hypothetical protein ACO1HA_01865, partial [Bacteroidota bacterium]